MTAKERRHSGKDRYRKVHIMMDLNKKQTIDVKVTPAYRKGTGDCSVGQEFIESIPDKVRTARKRFIESVTRRT